MNNYLKLYCVLHILTIAAFAQSDSEDEDEDTWLCRSTQKKTTRVQIQPGRPGKLGPPGAKGKRGVAGACECNPSEIELLNQRLNTLTDNLQRTNFPPRFYIDYCSVGMRDGRINDDDITASSTFNEEHSAFYGRLDYKGVRNSTRTAAGWAALIIKPGEWIQVDLKKPTYVTGVITQGRFDIDRWTSSYEIGYSNNTRSFQKILEENGNNLVFSGNMDRNTYVMNRFPQPIVARYFRLFALTYTIRAQLRLEYITC